MNNDTDNKNMKLLENNGYTKYKTNYKNDIIYPYSDCFYQKRIVDEKGIRYHIQFIYYAPIVNFGTNLEEDWMLDLITNEPFYSFRKHHIELKTKENLEKLEAECEKFWTVFKCAYYELYS